MSLPRRIGRHRTALARAQRRSPIDASTALDWGLVDRVDGPPRRLSRGRAQPEKTSPSKRSIVANAATGLRESFVGRRTGYPRHTIDATAHESGNPSSGRASTSARGEERRHHTAEPPVARRQQDGVDEGVDRRPAAQRRSLQVGVHHGDRGEVGGHDEHHGRVLDAIEHRVRLRAQVRYVGRAVDDVEGGDAGQPLRQVGAPDGPAQVGELPAQCPILDHRHVPGCRFPPLGAKRASSRSSATVASSTGSSVNSRMDGFVRSASASSMAGL